MEQTAVLLLAALLTVAPLVFTAVAYGPAPPLASLTALLVHHPNPTLSAPGRSVRRRRERLSRCSYETTVTRFSRSPITELSLAAAASLLLVRISRGGGASMHSRESDLSEDQDQHTHASCQCFSPSASYGRRFVDSEPSVWGVGQAVRLLGDSLCLSVIFCQTSAANHNTLYRPAAHGSPVGRRRVRRALADSPHCFGWAWRCKRRACHCYHRKREKERTRPP
jgi:hypothetical protein